MASPTLPIRNPTTTPKPPDSTSDTTTKTSFQGPTGPEVHTYHCLCTSILLATTHVLSTLPRRASPSLDQALILPLSRSLPSAAESESSDSDSNSDDDGVKAKAKRKQEQKKKRPDRGYTLLLGMSRDRKPMVVTREDGFERRSLWKCWRCRVVVGYQLDLTQFGDVIHEMSGGGDKDGRDGRDGGDGDKGKDGFGQVLYLLPAGIMSTEAMMRAKKVGDVDVALGGKDGGVVGVWE